MTEQEQRISIAEACGWVKHVDNETQNCLGWKSPNHGALLFDFVPDYYTDLNAMHEAERTLANDTKTDYIRLLNKGDFSCRRLAFATAAQRAEAFLRTIGKWKVA